MINFIAVIIITVIYFVLGALWYSPFLFGKIWMDALGYKQEDLQPKPAYFIGAAINAFVTTLILAVILEFIGTYDLLTALLVSLLIGIGFVLTVSFYDVIYEEKPIKAYIVDALYHVVAILIAGLILGLWQI